MKQIKQTFCYNSRKRGDDYSTCVYGEVKAYSLEMAKAMVAKICRQNDEIVLIVWEK